MNYSYPMRVLVAFDVFCSTLLGFSYADLTISACCGLALEGKRYGGFRGAMLRTVGRALNRLSKGHTATAIINDGRRAQAAVETTEL